MQSMGIQILINLRFFFFVVFRSKRTQTPWPTDVHQIPDPGAGEGVPHQPLPDPSAADRNGARPMPDRETDQDMVPKQEDEAEKRDTGHQGAERTGETSASAEGRRVSSSSGRR